MKPVGSQVLIRSAAFHSLVVPNISARLTTRLADNEARTFFNAEEAEFTTSTPNPEAMLGEENGGYRTYPGPGQRRQQIHRS